MVNTKEITELTEALKQNTKEITELIEALKQVVQQLDNF